MVAAPVKADTNTTVVFAIRPVLSQIAQLTAYQRAITAKIAAEFNSNCADAHCALTDSLNLGEQCSLQHKTLLRQTFGATAGATCTYQLNSARNSYVLRSMFFMPTEAVTQWRIALQYTVSFEGVTQCFNQERLYTQQPSGAMQETQQPTTPCVVNFNYE